MFDTRRKCTVLYHYIFISLILFTGSLWASKARQGAGSLHVSSIDLLYPLPLREPRWHAGARRGRPVAPHGRFELCTTLRSVGDLHTCHPETFEL